MIAIASIDSLRARRCIAVRAMRLDLLAQCGLMLAAAMCTLWILSLVMRNASIVDIAWGPAFVAVAWRMYCPASHTTLRSLLVALVTTWGLRLGAYLAWRNAGAGEDRRYRAMRTVPGRNFIWWSLVFVFAMQAALVLIVSLPIHSAMARDNVQPATWLALPGVIAWVVGMFFESVGDWQLARFRADPAGKNAVMDRGLWRYTRHPNYFGDFAVWWGIYLVALACGAAWWTFVGPLAMSVLLMRVSGVTLLESTIGERRPGYDAYVRRTSAFFPRAPRA